MERFNPGDKVRGIGLNSRALYEGTVMDPEYRKLYGAEAIIKVTKVVKGFGQTVGTEVNVINVERIEEMPYVKNLVGPKPEPVQGPKFPTPWTSDGSKVLDADRKVVVKLQYGGYSEGEYTAQLPLHERYDLAKIIAAAVTQFYAQKVEDSKSPF
jgi:hypothetical protein